MSIKKDSLPSQRVVVDLDFNAVECCTINGRFICYEVQAMPPDQDPPPEHPQRNAFTLMMAAARELNLPPKIFTTTDKYELEKGDHRLHDDIIKNF